MRVLIVLVIFLLSVQELSAQDTLAPVRELLSSRINNEYAGTRPLISNDGTTLYFGRRNHPSNLKGINDHEDVWYTELNNKGRWGVPKNLGAPVNNKKPNAICSINRDKTVGIFFNTHKSVNLPLVRSAKDKYGTWSAPEPIKIDDYYNHHKFGDFYFSFEHDVILMAVQRNDGHESQDIYVSKLREDGTYGKPINLGQTLNSKKDDFAPFLGSDGKTLFFASYGFGGHGGSDIFVAKRLDDTWQNWSKPVNLGKTVNSRKDELYCSVPGDFSCIYIDARTAGKTQQNLFKAALDQIHNPYLRGALPAKPANENSVNTGEKKISHGSNRHITSRRSLSD